MVNPGASASSSSPSSSPPNPSVGSTIEVFCDATNTFNTGIVANYDAARNRHTIKYTGGDSVRLVLGKERWRFPQPEMPGAGDEIEVWWPQDKKYYGGTVKSHNKRTGVHRIEYDDGEVEDLTLDEEKWRRKEESPRSVQGGRTVAKKGDRPEIGDEVEVYWPDDAVYYPGKVGKYDEKNGKYRIDYHDGDKELLNLDNETWRYFPKKNPSRKRKRGASSSRS